MSNRIDDNPANRQGLSKSQPYNFCDPMQIMTVGPSLQSPPSSPLPFPSYNAAVRGITPEIFFKFYIAMRQTDN
jgi:hypothetical protein